MEQRDWRQWKQQREQRPQWLKRHWSVWSGVSETWRYPPSPWRLSAAAAVAAPSLLSEIKGDNSKTCVSNVKILNQSMNCLYHDFVFITQLLDILLSWLTRVWQFSTLSWRSVVLSSRRYWIFSSMLVISWKKIIFKMTYLVLQSTCKIKLQNDTLLVTVFKGLSQIL